MITIESKVLCKCYFPQICFCIINCRKLVIWALQVFSVILFCSGSLECYHCQNVTRSFCNQTVSCGEGQVFVFTVLLSCRNCDLLRCTSSWRYKNTSVWQKKSIWLHSDFSIPLTDAICDVLWTCVSIYLQVFGMLWNQN